MTNDLREQVQAIQHSMVESGAECFLESELDDLRCLIRLTIEFFHYLQGEDLSPLVEDQVNYVCESVFSGVDSFCAVSIACRVMSGARDSKLSQGIWSIESLKEEFISLYREFPSETDFEKRCGLPLDLFKLQIVFAGLSYE